MNFDRLQLYYIYNGENSYYYTVFLQNINNLM